MPGAAHRQRKRRFAERELLDRIRSYEQLLSQNKIPFEPLHKDVTKDKGAMVTDMDVDSDDEDVVGQISTRSTTVRSDSSRDHATKNVWHAMSRGYRDSVDDSDSSNDGWREDAVKKAWDRTGLNDDHLLFGSSKPSINLSTLHPDPVQIFRLWQIYLDNVNPLLKVTHTPSLQGRIIDAASNITNINPILEALMFSIYSLAVLSLTGNTCQSMFGSSKASILTNYQQGCQQALSNCGFLRTTERDCLTAFYLYLVSVKSITPPQSLSSMLGIAIRTAQRMGIHRESVLTQGNIVEAEMRRRLWWSLVVFDSRVCEISDLKDRALNPTWNCNIPRNVSDSDLRPNMKEPPPVQHNPTEAIFTVVRSEVGEFIRHAEFQLDFTNPALKPISKHILNRSTPGGDDLAKFEQTIEEQYFRSCDIEDPLHFMTMWSTRAFLAKSRLMDHHSKYSSSPMVRTDALRDAATSYAIRMLECDTMIMTSPLTKGFQWLNHFYFPCPAYVQICQDLRIRPSSSQVERGWEAMNNNYNAWVDSRPQKGISLFLIVAKMVLQAWDALESIPKQTEDAVTPPKIVILVRETMAQLTADGQSLDIDRPNASVDMAMNDFSGPPPGSTGQNLAYTTGMEGVPTMLTADMYPGPSLNAPFGVNMNQLGWNTPNEWLRWGGY